MEVAIANFESNLFEHCFNGSVNYAPALVQDLAPWKLQDII